ncbi:hypothetical protein [Streptomyces mirabilis]|uniref:hypothetical protein n=1 Tax=Streptomyces mirabilis TaxID=68239 RepID=UPI003693A307
MGQGQAVCGVDADLSGEGHEGLVGSGGIEQAGGLCAVAAVGQQEHGGVEGLVVSHGQVRGAAQGGAQGCCQPARELSVSAANVESHLTEISHDVWEHLLIEIPQVRGTTPSKESCRPVELRHAGAAPVTDRAGGDLVTEALDQLICQTAQEVIEDQTEAITQEALDSMIVDRNDSEDD